jgi:hypothetical protein
MLSIIWGGLKKSSFPFGVAQLQFKNSTIDTLRSNRNVREFKILLLKNNS